jgi:glycosyltransferase involved in cell wall biosynthesis
VAEYAYPYLNGGGAGGAELQMILLGQELIQRGYHVHLITFADSDRNYDKIGGMKVHIPYNNKGSGFTHILPQNLFRFFSLLGKINADIHIQSAGTPLTGLISLFSQLKGKKFIFVSSSDANLSSALTVKHIQDLVKIPYKFGIKNADCIVAQTYHQKDLIRNPSGKSVPLKNSAVIKTIIPLKSSNEESHGKNVLWVGRIFQGKNPEKYMELASLLPEYNFKMIGSPLKTEIDYYKKIKKNTEKIKNLEFMGFIPHEKIHKYYLKAAVFVSTSSSEGFPNTFLEAWACRTPVVSLGFDPDGLLQKERLGFSQDNFSDMVKNIKTLMEDEKLRQEIGENGSNYVEKYHNHSKIGDDYEKLFKELLENNELY